MPAVGIAQSASRRREPILCGWIVVFAALLHVGTICLLLAAMPSSPVRLTIAGGSAGENGGGGMGFAYHGDGLGQLAPPPLLPQVHPSTLSKPTHQAAMTRNLTTLEQLEAARVQAPIPPPVDPRQMLGVCDARAVIGLAAASPDGSFKPHRGPPTFPGLANAQGDAGANAAVRANGSAAAVQFASAASPRGSGGDGGGAIGDPGARGNPGLGIGPASGMKPSYPAESKRRGEEGIVILAIEVLPDGQPGEIAVVQSSGFWRLDNAALEAARRGHYSPALVDGKPPAEKTRIIQPFAFHLIRPDGT